MADDQLSTTLETLEINSVENNNNINNDDNDNNNSNNSGVITATEHGDVSFDPSNLIVNYLPNTIDEDRLRVNKIC